MYANVRLISRLQNLKTPTLAILLFFCFHISMSIQCRVVNNTIFTYLFDFGILNVIPFQSRFPQKFMT